MLQKRLSRQYGYTGITGIELPQECETYLGEVPALMADKERQDLAAWKARRDKKNACPAGAVFGVKAFETLHRSTQ